MTNREELKMAIVAGASCALEYKERNPRATESEVMNHVTQQTSKIVRDIEQD